MTHSGDPRDGHVGPLLVGHTLVSSVQAFGQRSAWPSHVVYIGMAGNASRAFGIPEAEGYFGKPWSCLNHPLGWQTGYVRYVVARMSADARYEAAVHGLHGKTLLCWCASKGAEACHGMVLAEFVELLFHAK